MADCQLLTTCIFFNDKMSGAPVTVDLYKQRYCKSDNTECARYVVFRSLGREKVPGDMFPNDLVFARKLVDVPGG